MELLESDDPVKGQLLKKSAMHRNQIEEDARLISEQTERMITNALIIGGALAVTYLLVSQFSGGKSKSKKSKSHKLRIVHDPGAAKVAPPAAEPEEPSMISGVVSQIGTVLAGQATAFLLGLAKEKLTEFLEAQAAKQSSPNDPA